MFFSLGTLIATFSYIFTKKIYVRILLKTSFHEYKNNSKLSLKVKIIIQLIPIFIVALLFVSLIGYSRLIKEKGEIIFKLYDYEITEALERDIKTKDDIVGLLDKIVLVSQGDEVFIIPPSDGQIITNSGFPQLSEFFIKHMNEIALSTDGHVFDYYGVDAQGIAKQVLIDDQIWVIGARYLVGSDETLTFFAISFAALFVINFIVILYFAKTLTDDISRVTQNLEEIASGVDQTFEKRLVITSNDEIGDLVIAFNKIQNLEKRSIEAIKEQQAILIEQERLASLGQLIGGIAHNLKTPIMSISGGIEALKDLAYEYRDSVGDRSVTDQDHREIAKEMLTWLEKMKPYCAYMSDVISAVKGQAVQMISTNSVKFTVDEVIKRVELLLKHELKRYHCILKINSHVDASTEIKGEVNNLVQVFDNIIINAMQAYDGENGTIDLEIVRSGDNVEFTFKDYGKGIPKNVADRLFKEMITTKGKNGTGLGLYMSYATIRGRFGGNMSFITKEGCGTTFFISIPCITYGNQEEDK
ncbi:MAG: HAMP domain-containing histidine kinase [Clostridiaceae bacterium]|nr:HAMP domain-containing histidine kinase [Clostridiaceae bacterium]